MQSTALELLQTGPSPVPLVTTQTVPGAASSETDATAQPPFAAQFGELIHGFLKAGMGQTKGESGAAGTLSFEKMAEGRRLLHIEKKTAEAASGETVGQSVENEVPVNDIEVEKSNIPSIEPVSIPLPTQPDEQEPNVDTDLKDSSSVQFVQQLGPKVLTVHEPLERDAIGKSLSMGELKKNEPAASKTVAKLVGDVSASVAQTVPTPEATSGPTALATEVQAQQISLGAPPQEVSAGAPQQVPVVVPKIGAKSAAPQSRAETPSTRPMPKDEPSGGTDAQPSVGDKQVAIDSKSSPGIASGGVVSGGNSNMTGQGLGEGAQQDGRGILAHREIGTVAIHDARPTSVPALTDARSAQANEAGLGNSYSASQTRAPEPMSGSSTVLEVGMSQGVHGWLKVRAEMDDGKVMASLTPSTSGGKEMLHRELPSISTFLQQEKVGVSALVVKEASPPTALMSGEGGGMQRDGRSSQDRDPGGAGAANSRPIGGGYYEEEPVEEDFFSLTERTSSNMSPTGGGWLNVRV